MVSLTRLWPSIVVIVSVTNNSKPLEETTKRNPPTD